MGALEGPQLHKWTAQGSITSVPGPPRHWLAPSTSGCPATRLRPKSGRRQRLPKRLNLPGYEANPEYAEQAVKAFGDGERRAS